MRIALTGGTGFIGQCILKLYSGQHTFKVLTRSLEGKKDLYKHPAVTYYVTDYSTKELAPHLTAVDSAIHLAAHRPTPDDTIQHYLDSILISFNFFHACSISGIRKAVDTSSRSVYSQLNSLPWSESQMAVPANLYGVSKLTVENMANLFNGSANMNITSLRLAQVIGLGEREGFMFKTFLNNALAKRPLHIHGTGSGKREYIYVKDVATAIMCAIETDNAKGVFNIGTGRNTSHRELATTINQVFDNRGNLIFLPDQPDDPSVNLMDITRATKELGFMAQYNLRMSLEDMKKDMGFSR